MNSSNATPEGTRDYFKKHPLSVVPVRLGRTGLMVLPVGFGCYRVSIKNPEHETALQLALGSGCNIIDTSTNYMDGRSEELVGRVLRSCFDKGDFNREQIVVVTKVGYVQGENMDLARSRIEQGNPFTDMVEYHEDCWHCISPDFLEDQISRSLKRLGLECIDVLLLHNPEYFLKTDSDFQEYYRRIDAAFRHLENEAARGRIHHYGISSNTFPEPKDSPEYTSLETVLEIAEKISAQNHFAVIQFPLNLLEPGAALEKNNGSQAVCELALAKDIGTLVNRPLNTYVFNRLVRLADFPAHEGEPLDAELRASFRRAIELESSAQPHMPAGREFVPWAHVIQSNRERLASLDVWRQVWEFQIEPALENLSAGNEWAKEYKKSLNTLANAFTKYLEAHHSQESKKISAIVEKIMPELAGIPSLSQKMITVYRSVPGVSCVLVGMRRENYVRDALLLHPKIPSSAALRVLQDSFEQLERTLS